MNKTQGSMTNRGIKSLTVTIMTLVMEPAIADGLRLLQPNIIFANNP